MHIMRALAAAAVLSTSFTTANAQSWPTFPIDETVPHRGFYLVVRKDGVNWYSERGARLSFTGAVFDLLRGSFEAGKTVQVVTYEADCRAGLVRRIAASAGKTVEDVDGNFRYIGGPWLRPVPGAPDAIRAGEACMDWAFTQ